MPGTATAPPKRLYDQTPIPRAGALVVTALYGASSGRRGYESRVEGGRLDGWTLWGDTAAEARGNHDGMARLVRETAER